MKAGRSLQSTCPTTIATLLFSLGPTSIIGRSRRELPSQESYKSLY